MSLDFVTLSVLILGGICCFGGLAVGVVLLVLLARKKSEPKDAAGKPPAEE